MDKKVSIRYDPDGDMLEVWWGTDRGYYTATGHNQVEANVDLGGCPGILGLWSVEDGCCGDRGLDSL